MSIINDPPFPISSAAAAWLEAINGQWDDFQNMVSQIEADRAVVNAVAVEDRTASHLAVKSSLAQRRFVADQASLKIHKQMCAEWYPRLFVESANALEQANTTLIAEESRRIHEHYHRDGYEEVLPDGRVSLVPTFVRSHPVVRAARNEVENIRAFNAELPRAARECQATLDQMEMNLRAASAA